MILFLNFLIILAPFINLFFLFLKFVDFYLYDDFLNQECLIKFMKINFKMQLNLQSGSQNQIIASKHIIIKSKMTALTVFCMTGFTQDPNSEQYQSYLDNIGGKYSDKLSQNVKALVVKSVCTQKYKMARLQKNPIQCVTQSWLIDSKKQGYIKPVTIYALPETYIFYGVKVALCGFTKQKTQSLQKIIKKYEGTVITKYNAPYIIKNCEQLEEDIDVILATDDQFQRSRYSKIPQKLDDNILPIVGLQWLQHSIKQKRCKLPKDYALNLQFLPYRVPLTNFTFRLSKKQQIFANYFISEFSNDYFKDVVAYFCPSIDGKITKKLKTIISLCGGFWLNKFNSLTTHVLSGELTSAQFQAYKKYGNRVQIVRAQWLIDSVTSNYKLKQEDYYVRSFKTQEKHMANLIESQKNIQKINSQRLPTKLENKYSVNSLQFSQIKMMYSKSYQTGKKKAQRRGALSLIFKDKKFYFQNLNQSQKQKEQQDIQRKIRDNSGSLFSKINRSSFVYLPLKDSPNNQTVIEEHERKKYLFRPVSYRWINYCIKRNQFIEPKDDENYFIFRAFDFFTPVPQFHKYVFEFVGIDDTIKRRLRQLLPVLGSTKTSPNKSELTHVLCGQNWGQKQSRQKIEKILGQNKKVRLVKMDWLMACLNQKGMADIQGYHLQEEQIGILSTPQKLTCNQQSLHSAKTQASKEVRNQNQVQ